MKTTLSDENTTHLNTDSQQSRSHFSMNPLGHSGPGDSWAQSALHHLGRRLSGWPLYLAFLSLLTTLAPAKSPDFPIATKGVAISFASDGNNYLVGIENHLTSPPTIGAQLISSSGTPIGSLIRTGRTGIATAIAFDGNNYLLIWEDDGLGTLNGATGMKIYGQFVSKAGTLVGSPFAVTTSGIWIDGIKTMDFGGGKYLVTYTRLIVPAKGDASNNRIIAGRMVSPDGTLGNEFRISSGFGDASEVAFDGANFLVVWCEDSGDTEIRGRFVNPEGVPGTEISINASNAPSDNPKSVAFDGVNYLVVWNDEVGGQGTGNWDSFGQLVNTSGSLVGGPNTITNEPGQQMTTSASFDGSNYLAVWVDMRDALNWDMYGQFISKDGSLVGDKIAISTETGNQLGGTGFANGKHLVLVNDGILMGGNGIEQITAAAGVFVAPPASLQIQTFDPDFGVRANGFGFNITGPSGQEVIVEACTDLRNPKWLSVGTKTLINGSSTFSDPQWMNNPNRFFRLRPTSTQVQAGWIQTQINPQMGWNLYVSDTEIFAATFKGIFSTTNDGMPWFSRGPADQAVFDVIKSHEFLLAATYDGIYRSADNGISWHPTSGSPRFSGPGATRGPSIFAKTSASVFSIAWAEGVFRSVDDGKSWQKVPLGTREGFGGDIGGFASCIGAADEKIFVGVQTGNPTTYSSSDNGETWESQTIESQMPGDLLCLYYNDGRLFAGGFSGLYLSTDLGKSWTAQYSNSISPDGRLVGLGMFRNIVAYNQTLVAAVDFHSIQMSHDNGITWSDFNSGLISDWTFAALAIKPPYIWAINSFFGNAYRRLLSELGGPPS